MPDVEFLLDAVYVGIQELNASPSVAAEIPIDLPIELVFTTAIDPATAAGAIEFLQGTTPVAIQLQYSNSNKNVRLSPQNRLQYNTEYTLRISTDLKSESGAAFAARQLLFKTVTGGNITVTNLRVDGQAANSFSYLHEISLQPTINLHFSAPIDTHTVAAQVRLTGGAATAPVISFSADRQQTTLRYTNPLQDLKKYTFSLQNGVKGAGGEAVEGISQVFYTQVDSTPKFPLLTDEQLLTLVQQQTFRYFWDFAHPVSGLIRERNTSGELVTSGGSGFGLMAIPVGIERGFISRQEGVDRLLKIVTFLETSERFHGVWPHWLNGTTGKVIPFSADDDGGDLVETAYLAMGLLTVRQYLDAAVAAEKDLMDRINVLWEGIEWSWHTQGGQQVLYWHWSPNFGWVKNHKISGYNEALITYIMAAASPGHAIDAAAYHEGWARNGAIRNGNTFYDVVLPLGNQAYGGPLFFEQYTYLGIDPRQLQDTYASYWDQAVNHTLINRAYCIDNPKEYVGYGPGCWGLTASDNHDGYSAHSPTNDLGVITPTAALASFPFTPDHSMEALHHFYYTLGDRIWKEYGFVDAFNFTEEWVANSFLAIDQGPILLMIENHRSGLLWDLFMSCPEVHSGLTKLGFTY